MTMTKQYRIGTALIAATILTSGPASFAAGTSPESLNERILSLEQQLSSLRAEVDAQKAVPPAAPAPASPKISITDKGFSFASADGANAIRLRGIAQFDGRVFVSDNHSTSSNTFVLRRARIITEGMFAKNYSFQFVPEFGSGSATIVDAAVGVSVNDSLQLKFGKFTSPVGLERLQGVAWNFFNEASLASDLVPNRDVGAQASGKVAKGTLAYAVGVFDGAPDDTSINSADYDNDKDLVARLFASPFKNEKESVLQGLSFGVAGSFGRQKSASGHTAGYKSEGQQTFFSYLPATVADGHVWRVSPQADFRLGSFGAMAEYVMSSIDVASGAASTQLKNQAWQLSAGYVLTGEASSYTGVVPNENFDFGAGTWGAFEIVARYSGLQVDDAAFPLFADAASSADEATSFGLGCNWYLSKTVKFSLDYYHTGFNFDGDVPAAPSSAGLRQDEQVVTSRVQVAF